MAWVTVRYWGGAKRAAGTDEERLEAVTVGEARAVLAARPELTRVCAAASFLLDGVAAHDDTVLSDGSVLDVLPPFAGG